MDFGIFNLMGAPQRSKPTAQVFGEVAEQTKLADALGYTIAWFAEHHFSNYCLCASPLMMVAPCASITTRRTLRRAPFLELLPVRIALDDGGALRLDHEADPARHRRRGLAALQPGSSGRRG